MEDHKGAVEKIIHSIDWKKIKSYHKKLNILWEFHEDKEVYRRLPYVSELKSELRSIFDHMMTEDLSYISYGNWIIFWDRDEKPTGDIRVIFRLADFVFEEDTTSQSNLELALEKAIEKEDYEHAAIIRDALNKKDTKQ
jgi:hypothetical protein